MRHVKAYRNTYTEAKASFDLDAELAQLLSNEDGGSNAAEICCDRHSGLDSRLALRHRSASGANREWTFAELKTLSSRLASVLAGVGIGPGDRVSALLPRTPELLVTMLAVWRLGAVYQPLFTAFGPKAIGHRLAVSGARVVVTDGANRSKLSGLTGDLTIISVQPEFDSSDIDFWGAVDGACEFAEDVRLTIDDPFLMMFTSGTTGLPKPLLVPIRALASFISYMRDAVGLSETDVFWNLGDPGWAYGLYFGVLGPLAMGNAIVFHEGPFSVNSTYDTILEYGVTNLAGAPTAYRAIVADGPESAKRILGQLRAVSSAGEPLNPEIIRWFDRHLNVQIADHFGQTEVGMIVCNHHALQHPVHVGSAGYATLGHRAVVLSQNDRELEPGEPGELALDVAGSPFMWFKGYYCQDTPALTGGYYRTGDTVELNEDGSISFVGRADDVITTSGYRVGPFDVESALIEHPAVMESAVVGKPDPERTEIIKAFVVLKPDYEGSAALSEELRLHVRERLSAHAYPREIEFVDQLPKTPSGKIQRFMLRGLSN